MNGAANWARTWIFVSSGSSNYELNLSPMKLVFFTRIFNLFDTRNQTSVYGSTGRADYDWYNEMIARNMGYDDNTINRWFTDATKYSEPRRIEFGINLEF